MEMMKTKRGEQCVAHKKIEKRKDGSVRVTTINVEPSRTKQEFAEQANANWLMKRFGYNQLPDPGQNYHDLTQLPDLHEALETVRRATESFSTLPSTVRLRFQNDPNELINFLHNDDNRDEAIKLGLINPKPVPAEDPQLTALKEIATNTKSKKKADD